MGDFVGSSNSLTADYILMSFNYLHNILVVTLKVFLKFHVEALDLYVVCISYA